MKPKAIVLRTAGTNCDYETVHVLDMVGFETDLVHINELIRGDKKLLDYQLLVIPGGFSHGDYLGSAKILANKMTYKLGNEIPQFIEKGNLVLGICNGFQALVKAGILPGFKGNYKKQETTLTINDSGHFQDEWIELENVNKGKCIFTKGIDFTIPCPINHGEGKFVASEEIIEKLGGNDQVVFKYVKNPNGSYEDIAGICDESGRVLGLMPHPEKFFTHLNSPQSTRTEIKVEAAGLAIFRNAFAYFK